MKNSTISRLNTLFLLLTVLFLPINDANSILNSNGDAKEIAISPADFTIIHQVTNIKIIDVNEIIVFEDIKVINNMNTSATEIPFWINQTIKHIEVEDYQGELNLSIVTDYSYMNLITVILRNNLESGQITSVRVIYGLDIDV
ncbi:MAG: hypothetical protein ACTSQ2_14485, partial [Candidatus Heimdallarchaeaceae archaeon]